MAETRRPFWRTLYFWVLVGDRRRRRCSAGSGPRAGEALQPLGDGFIKLVKMIITPVIFLTVVTGIAGMADLKAFGRVGAKAMGYFLAVSTLALAIGLVVANLVQPGAGLNVDPRSARCRARSQSYVNQAHEQSVTGFLLNIIPDTLVSAFTEGQILQVLFVAILFGIALALIGEKGARLLAALQDADRDRLPDRPHPDVRRPGRRVRRDGLHHRQIWHRHARQSRRAGRAPSTRPRLLFVIVVLGADRARRRLLAAGAGPLHQGRAAARARHLLVGKRDAAADGEARARRLPEADRRPGRADRLFVQPRRHLHLHVAGRPVHRPGLQHPAHASATSCC